MRNCGGSADRFFCGGELYCFAAQKVNPHKSSLGRVSTCRPTLRVRAPSHRRKKKSDLMSRGIDQAQVDQTIDVVDDGALRIGEGWKGRRGFRVGQSVARVPPQMLSLIHCFQCLEPSLRKKQRRADREERRQKTETSNSSVAAGTYF